MFHKFAGDIVETELPRSFNNPFYYSPHRLCIVAADEVRGMLRGDEALATEVVGGKMFGVLVVRNKVGEVGYLAAFSGLLSGNNKVDGFVPPVYDMQHPQGYFKCEEAEISKINAIIAGIKQSNEFHETNKELENTKQLATEAIESMRNRFDANKHARAVRRASQGVTPEDEARMIKESQFEKAELKRAKQAWQQRVAEKELCYNAFVERLAALSAERRDRSMALQKWLFEQFKVLNAKGEEQSLLNIFRERLGTFPPAGAGECAAPKLLQYAYKNNYTPLAMAEFWVGTSPVGEVRRDGCFYGACKSKCEPILGFMLQGLDVEENALEKGGDISSIQVIYEDEHLLVVDKPSGVLSVPGVVGGTSVQQWLREEYLRCNGLFVAHRLDMATSGLLVAAKSMEVYRELQRRFASRDVQKQYTAILEGMPVNSGGIIELPLAADYENRPRQKVDYADGKPAVTRYKVIGTVERDGHSCAVVCFEPVTGRTHQLRVHAAHKDGLDSPIVGDALYGTVGERLMLHASFIAFTHPVTGETLEFSCVAPFCNVL